MLSKPEDGWTDFQLGSMDTAFCLSYLTDVAVEWLDQAIHGLETLDVFSVHGFCEPGRMVCTVSYWNCYLIFEGDDRDHVCESVQTVHVSMIDFCRRLYEDISANLEDWVHWDDGEIESSLGMDEGYEPDAFERAIAERRKTIKVRLDRLKQLINENEENFGENCCFF